MSMTIASGINLTMGPWDHGTTIFSIWKLERSAGGPNAFTIHAVRVPLDAAGPERNATKMEKKTIEKSTTPRRNEQYRTVLNKYVSHRQSVPLCIWNMLPLLELDCVSRLGTRCHTVSILFPESHETDTPGTRIARTRSRHSRLTHLLHWNQDLLSPSHAREEHAWDCMRCQACQDASVRFVRLGMPTQPWPSVRSRGRNSRPWHKALHITQFPDMFLWKDVALR